MNPSVPRAPQNALFPRKREAGHLSGCPAKFLCRAAGAWTCRSMYKFAIGFLGNQVPPGSTPPHCQYVRHSILAKISLDTVPDHAGHETRPNFCPAHASTYCKTRRSMILVLCGGKKTACFRRTKICEHCDVPIALVTRGKQKDRPLEFPAGGLSVFLLLSLIFYRCSHRGSVRRPVCDGGRNALPSPCGAKRRK